jgi:hypothetical protein
MEFSKLIGISDRFGNGKTLQQNLLEKGGRISGQYLLFKDGVTDR